MKYRTLGKSDLCVSEIGFGCMSLGLDKQRATVVLHEALDGGINFFDTADLYDGGVNEEIVGEAFKGKRSQVILATKVGNRRKPGVEGLVWDPSKAYIKEAVKGSLRRLQTDYIDLYQLHGGTIDDPIDETIEAFEELKREGWIRYYGISSIRPNVIREYARRSHIVSVMNQYSIVDRRGEEDVFPLLAREQISVIARGPVATGILSERYREKAANGFLDYTADELIELVGHLAKLVDSTHSLSQLALRYPLANPAVATVIPGASSLEQLRQNIAAGGMPALTAQELDWIRTYSKANTYTAHR